MNTLLFRFRERLATETESRTFTFSSFNVAAAVGFSSRSRALQLFAEDIRIDDVACVFRVVPSKGHLVVLLMPFARFDQ